MNIGVAADQAPDGAEGQAQRQRDSRDSDGEIGHAERQHESQIKHRGPGAHICKRLLDLGPDGLIRLPDWRQSAWHAPRPKALDNTSLYMTHHEADSDEQ